MILILNSRVSMDTRSRSTRVLMFPWLAHGHIAPFLLLAKSLATHNFVSYICSSPINLTSIRPQISAKDSISIKLVELHLPTTLDLPPHYHTTNGLPPNLMSLLKKALDQARPAFSTILTTLNPDIVVYDFLQPWAPEEAALKGIPAVLFLSTGAAATSLIVHRWFDAASDFPFPEMENVCTVFYNDDSDRDRLRGCVERSCDVVLIRSFRDLEGKYLDFLSDLTRKEMVSVGPLIHELEENRNQKDDEIMEWLDRKDAGSTVFASFGTEYFLSEKEIEEIAYGLELSRVNFVWVVRFPVGERIEIREKLPLGFLERIGERGLVVQDWAPQRRILSHPSVGGFLSHCGWSSVMEGVYSGVPIIAAPMQLDQPMNAQLVEEVGCGEVVARGRDGNLDRRDVARVVRKVVVEEGGEGMRRRVAEMSGRMREKGEREIEGVVKEMVRLCWRKREILERENSMKELNLMMKRSREGMLSEHT